MTTGVHVKLILTYFFSCKDRASERYRPHRRKKHRTCPSMVLMKDSVLSSAATFSPRYSSLNQQEWPPATPRKTPLLVAQGQRGHPSQCSGHLDFRGRHSGVRIPWVQNVPVCKEKSPILDTHWLAMSRLMVILASGHGSQRGQTVEQL